MAMNPFHHYYDLDDEEDPPQRADQNTTGDEERNGVAMTIGPSFHRPGSALSPSSPRRNQTPNTDEILTDSSGSMEEFENPSVSNHIPLSPITRPPHTVVDDEIILVRDDSRNNNNNNSNNNNRNTSSNNRNSTPKTQRSPTRTARKEKDTMGGKLLVIEKGRSFPNYAEIDDEDEEEEEEEAGTEDDEEVTDPLQANIQQAASHRYEDSIGTL